MKQPRCRFCVYAPQTGNEKYSCTEVATTPPNFQERTTFIPLVMSLEEFRILNKESGENPPTELPTVNDFAGVNIVCGPILRFAGMLENNTENYRGSILLAIKGDTAPPEVTYKISPSSDSGSFPVTPFFETKGVTFYRYNINLTVTEVEQTVAYSINGSRKLNFQFFIQALSQSMNVVHFSCNGFSLATETAQFKSSLWLDVLEKHDAQKYHVMLGNGDQIYSDAVKVHSEEIQKWAAKTKREKRAMKASPELYEELEEFYFTNYLGWFGQGYWKGKGGLTLQLLFPAAMATIPLVNIYDDHDIIDGFGSYKDKTMVADVFAAIGNTAYKYYMIFQHHTVPTLEGSVEDPQHLSDPSWILGDKPGPFIKQKNHSIFTRLGKEISLLAVDCRTERKLKEVVEPSTYRRIFTRVDKELDRTTTKHLLVMLGVPVLYPRLVWLEWLLTSKVLKPVRAMATSGIINKGLVNEFDGAVEVLDDLNDHWCSKNHKRERNKLIRDLMHLGALHGVRITILSGDVHLAAISRLQLKKLHHHPHRDKPDILPEHDPRLMFNIISSAIVNAPPPDAMASLLNKRSKIHHYDSLTDEDVIPVFATEVDGSARANTQFLNKRNWSDLIIASQSYLAEETNDEAPRYVLPGQRGASKRKDENPTHVAYPLLSDSLVTTIHVEISPLDFSAETAPYEVVIPGLKDKVELERTIIKHLTELD